MRWPAAILLALSVASPLAAHDEQRPHCLDDLEAGETVSADLRFAILPDRTGQERPGVFAQAVSTIDGLAPDFVISVGDIIEGYTPVRTKVLQEWDEAEQILATLDAPFCAVPGNHDIWDAASEAIWHERLGPTHYSFRRGDILFLMLNTEDPPVVLDPKTKARQARMKEAWGADPVGTQQRILDAVRERPPAKLPGTAAISDGQRDWALNLLQEHSDARWTFVILHRPAWQYDNANWAIIEAALQGRGATVIAGHEHYFESEMRGDVQHIVVATAGGVWLRDGPGRLDHVLLITMSEDDAAPRIASYPLAEDISARSTSVGENEHAD